MSNKHSFYTAGYLHIPKGLGSSACAAATKILRDGAANGEFKKDAQCLMSPAVYGHREFDRLLEEMLPHIEEVLGKKLLPTYSYARLYQHGDELKPHTDRPACEVSATVTLDYNGDVWPFFIADDLAGTNTTKILAERGDVILYQGMNKPHWREKFTGDWQSQVFLHYVYADGPHSECVFDGREALAHNVIVEDDLLYWVFEDAITNEECDSVISNSLKIGVKDATIGTQQHVDRSYRDTKRCELPTYKGIGATLAGIAMSANSQAWAFEVTHSDQCELLQYEVDGHYDVHIDTFMYPGRPCRKLTTIAILNDNYEGGKFYIKTGRKKIYPPQTKGSVIVFPSFLQHGVENVTKGVRYSAVCWLVGPFFK